MGTKEKMPIQFGISWDADFEDNRWSFLMPNEYAVCAGEFAIMDKETLGDIKEALIAAQRNFEQNKTGGFNGDGKAHESGSPYLKIAEILLNLK